MKSLITYYSYSGHADKVAQKLAEFLKNKGNVDIQRLRPRTEIDSFGAQCRAAFLKRRAELENGITFDVSRHDLVVIGSPVWAFASTPAVNTFLDKVNGLHGKKVAVFLTSGSGVGVKKCFKNIRTILESKGASHIEELSIPDSKLNDESFVNSSIEGILSHLVV